MRGEQTKFYIALVVAILGIFGTIVFGSLYMYMINLYFADVDPEIEMVYEDEVSDDSQHAVSLTVGDDELFLWPESYEVRFGNKSYGSLRNISLPGSPFQNQWFYQTTDKEIIGIRHLPDTYTSYNDTGFINPKAEKAILITNHLLKLNLTFYSPQHLNDWPITRNITLNLTDEACSTIPESVYVPDQTGEIEGNIQEYLSNCDTNYPISVSEILVDGKSAFVFPEQRVYRTQGAFDGTISYSLVPEDEIEEGAPVGIFFLGINADINKVYFGTLGNNYSVDSDGTVRAESIPDNLVTISLDLYE